MFSWIYGQEANCKLFCLNSQNTRKRTGTINPPAADSFYTPPLLATPTSNGLAWKRNDLASFCQTARSPPLVAKKMALISPLTRNYNFRRPLPLVITMDGWGLCQQGAGHLNSPLFKWSLPISCHFLFYLNAFVYHRFAWIHRQLELSVVNLTTILVMGNHFLCLSVETSLSIIFLWSLIWFFFHNWTGQELR